MMRRLLIVLFFLGSILTLNVSVAVAQNDDAPTPYEYAVMSSLAYDPDDTNLSNKLPDEWIEYDNSNQSIVNRENDNQGYYGIAYINRDTNQVVIAHRGTDVWVTTPSVEIEWQGIFSLPDIDIDFGDVDDNIYRIARGLIPDQFTLSTLPFVQRVSEAAGEEYTITHTGHSLGAVLAELSTVFFSQTSAVTFDSPGTTPMIPPATYNIVSYMGAPNMVNTTNQHTGDIILVDPDWDEALRTPSYCNGAIASVAIVNNPNPFTPNILQGLHGMLGWFTPDEVNFDIADRELGIVAGYVDYSLQAHSMGNILAAFETETTFIHDIESWWPQGAEGSFRYFIDQQPPSISVDALFDEIDDLGWFANIFDYIDVFQSYLARCSNNQNLSDDHIYDIYEILVVYACNFEAECLSNVQEMCYIEEADTFDLICLRSVVEGTELTNADSTLLDLIFVIDTTSSMRDDIDAVKLRALEIINSVANGGANWRIAIVTYRDHPQRNGEESFYVSNIDLDFSNDQQRVISIINGLQVAGGGADIPEAVYSGLLTAIGLDWRDGAKKALVLMGDAPPHDPEPVTGYTMDTVLQAAFNVDPANIYPIIIENNSNTFTQFQRLADGSSGQLFSAGSATDVVEAISSTIGSINYQPELSQILDPGDQARVFVTGGDTLNVREGPGTNFNRVDRLSIGEIVTIIDGPVYADTYLWWNLETPRGIQGWAVEAADGIVTLAPLSFEGVSTYVPPENRSITPDNAIILTGGRGLTNGVLMGPGEFQVEWYCNNQGYGVGEDGTDWYCTGGFTLQISDFDAICQATYNYASAFAVQDGSNGAPAYNWRCYGPR